MKDKLRVVTAADSHDAGHPGGGAQVEKVCVVGLGYIGLPTACVLARKGYRVLGVDVRREVVDKINSGRPHIQEPDLDDLLGSVVAKKLLQAADQPGPADVFILCVPTPITDDCRADVSYVQQAARSIRPYVRPGNLVILESTSPPCTTERVVAAEAIPAELKIGRDVFVAHCPERVLPGRILTEVIENDRIVGGITEPCGRRAQAFYESFVTGRVLRTSALAAEITKLVENSYRDVNIAFANELSMFADHFGVDPWEIISLANRHPRVNILNPGPGVGGHCISVDPWFLVEAAPSLTRLIRTAREVNNSKPHHVVRHVLQLAAAFDHPVIGCLGLTYKADVDDLRESPSLEIARELRAAGAGEVLACDPLVAHKFTEFPLHSLDEVLSQSQLLVLLTDHDEFRRLPASALRGKVVVDTRGVWRNSAAELRLRHAG